MNKSRLDKIKEIKTNSKAKTKDKAKLKQAEINELVLDMAKILGLV